MATHNAEGKELFICGVCKCRRTVDEYDVDRHGHRRKGCTPCRLKREAKKCHHGRRKELCEICSPEKFCEHGHCINRHTCEICDPAGNERRKKVRNACEFAQQEGGWPFKHYCFGPRIEYDTIVNKWMATFTKLLKDGVIDEERHAKIFANLSPWIAEDHAQRIKHLEGAVAVPR